MGPKRFKSKENLNLVRNQPCLACKKRGPSDPDHIRSRGAGGDDSLSNLMPLCRTCHVTRHAIGIQSFVKRYNLPITFEYGYPRRADIL